VWQGEGWGLPVVEAMSMELPVIVTDYSGPAAYLTEQNAYPLRYRPPSASTGGQVTPDSAHLRELMRRVTIHREEAVARGRVARGDMVSVRTHTVAAFGKVMWPG
jgi:glycosyltransferase involved in cell wall biosynthesis